MSTHHTPRHRSSGRTGFGRSPWPSRPTPAIPSSRPTPAIPSPRRPLDDLEQVVLPARRLGPAPHASPTGVRSPRSRPSPAGRRPGRPRGPRWLAPATALLLAGILVGAAVAVGVLGVVGVHPGPSSGATRFAGTAAPTSIVKI